VMRAKGRPGQPEAAFVVSGFRMAAQRDGPAARSGKEDVSSRTKRKTTMIGPFDHAASAWGHDSLGATRNDQIKRYCLHTFIRCSYGCTGRI
jgi:hypothetical protein